MSEIPADAVHLVTEIVVVASRMGYMAEASAIVGAGDGCLHDRNWDWPRPQFSATARAAARRHLNTLLPPDCRLRRTDGPNCIDDLAVHTEKLPCTVLTLNRPCE